MNVRAIACVMEQTLGSITHYLNLRRHESAYAGCNARWLPVEYRDAAIAGTPWTVTGSLAARRALKPVLEDVDGIFIHTATLAPLTVDYFRRKPTIVSADGTPLNKRSMRSEYGLKPEWRATERAKQLVYREVFAQARGFVAWSNWAKQSFVEDYRCREEDVAVIPPGIDVEQFHNAERDHELPRILFVGGDFVRKGGDLLLKVFRQRLRGKAELLLVTRDQVEAEPGVSIHRNVVPNSPALLGLYRDADIFVLPTRADCYSLVCIEALASGLPCVSTNVGGIADILDEGKTGHLLNVGDGAGLGDVLEALVADRARRQEMGRLGREVALSRFDSRENARKLFEFICGRC
ncbi:MAG TPA: glycosyltransferase family 4 protein [Polyangiaceae bacterium]|nr:glycosyltransferase family 4 protein [Polyangiaceae bacterium]